MHKQQQGHANDAAEINRDAAQAKRLKQIARKISTLRRNQNELNAEPKSKLAALASRESQLANEAAKVSKELDTEAKDAAERRAPQTSDITKASEAVAGAQSKMKSARRSMQDGQRDAARQSGNQASKKLSDANEHIGRALKTLEKKRLADTKETAIKQGETEKQTTEAARTLKQLSKENENTSKEASQVLDKSGGKVAEAGQSMKTAHASMERSDTVEGERAAQQAADKLAEAQRMLEELRDKLAKKQKEQKLLDLIVELQPMLEKQIEINDETRRIDTETARRKLPEPARPGKVRLGQLADDENQLSGKTGKLLSRLEGESAPVFVWGFRKLGNDMDETKELLAAFNIGSYTQDVEKDIADTLQMLIDALKREQSKIRRGGGGGGGGGGAGGKPMLVPPSAQLKLLKARQLAIHNATKRIELKRLITPQKDLSSLQKKRIRRLAKEQVQLSELTDKLAESLEREVRRRQTQMGETQ